MRKLIGICSVLVLSGLFGLFGMLINAEKVSAASLQNRPCIAVLPYVNKATASIIRESEDLGGSKKTPNISLQDATLVTDIVIEQLMDTDRFTLLEREYLQEVLNELFHSQGETIDSSSVLRTGKQLGAQILAVGSISGLSAKDSGLDANITKAKAGFNKMAVVANVTIRFIDVETSEIILTASGTGESARTNAEFSLKKNVVDTYETDSVDASGYETVNETAEVSTSEVFRVKIGGQDYSLDQVRNALYKAVGDMIYNKNYGILAKMDGQGKRRKV